MKYEDYMEKRKGLLNEAQMLIDGGNNEEANAKMAEIESLDNAYEDSCKAVANLNALKGTNVGRGLNTVNPTTTTIDNTVDKDKVYKDAFANYLMGNSLTKEQQTVFDDVNSKFKNDVQTATDHQVLIPETVVAGIWQEIGEMHPIFGDVAPTFVKGDLTIIKDKDTTSAAWYDEETPTATDDVAFETLTLKGCELAKAIKVSWKLKKMSIDAFLTYVTSKIAEKMGNAISAAIVSGTGIDSTYHKDQPYGIVKALEAESSTPQVAEYTALSYDDVAKAFGLIKSGYSKVIYANSKTIWNVLALIKDSTGRPIFMANPIDGGVGKIFGATVKEEDAIADDALLVGDVARGYVMNINENVSMHYEDHILDRTTDYMGYAIIDGNVITTKAFAYLKKSE